ncbi:MAG: RDD family protein [Actinomycetota bacterium]
MTAPGWYPAPMDPAGTRRWWDGVQWTSQLQQPSLPPTPPTPRPLAPIPMRIAARAIDFVIVMILASAINRAWMPRVLGADAYDTTGLLRLDEILPEEAGATQLLALVVIAILWELYWLLSEGATPGKQLLGLYVSDPGSERGTVELLPASKRNIHRAVGVIPFGWLLILASSVGSLVLMFNDRLDRQSLMDRFAGTTVHRLPAGSPRLTPWFQVWLVLLAVAHLVGWILN